MQTSDKAIELEPKFAPAYHGRLSKISISISNDIANETLFQTTARLNVDKTQPGATGELLQTWIKP